MNTAISNLSHAMQRKAVGVLVDTVLKQVDKDRANRMFSTSR